MQGHHVLQPPARGMSSVFSLLDYSCLCPLGHWSNPPSCWNPFVRVCVTCSLHWLQPAAAEHVRAAFQPEQSASTVPAATLTALVQTGWSLLVKV